ncbi:MAG: energy transducer TonB [bacterium]|nr:energy transducer TonB [bacterium]
MGATESKGGNVLVNARMSHTWGTLFFTLCAALVCSCAPTNRLEGPRTPSTTFMTPRIRPSKAVQPCDKPDRNATLVYRAEPEYTAEAEADSMSGAAMIRVLVMPDGSVVEAILHASSGFDVLDEAALKAAMRCTFEPAMIDCTLRDAIVGLTFRFPPARDAGRPGAR